MEAVPHMRKFVLAGGIAVLAVLGTSATAFGKGCSDNQNVPSSVAQYTEQQPTACGTHATGQGTHTRPVPKSLQKQIDSQGGEDAATITKIVSSESAGAPQTKIKVHKAKVKKVHKSGTKRGGQTPTKKVVSDAKRSQSNPLAASVGVITDGSDGRLIGLIVLMVGLAVVVVVSALRRRRVTR